MFSDTDLEELLGWNDGTRVGIKSHALGSITVQCHEAIHGRIFNETADGHLHRLCCMASRTELDRHHSGAYTEAASIMFEDTRLAHEAAATYLSIQGLPTRAFRRAELKKLSREYREYYALLDEAARHVSPTTWVRYALSWSFIQWCFQSRRFELFFATEKPDLTALEVACPTERFIVGKDFLLSDGRVHKWAEHSLSEASGAFCAKGFELWDFHSETAWNKRDGRVELKAFENHLTAEASHWLAENMPFESADFDRLPETFGPGFAYVMRELRLIPAPLFSGVDSALDSDFQRANCERLARAHSADIVEHRPSCSPKDLTTSPFAEVMGECLQGIGLSTHVIILSHANENNLILLCRRRIGEGLFHYEDVGSFLIDRKWAPLLVQGRLAPGPDGSQKPELWVMLRTSRERLIETMMIAVGICADPEKPVSPQNGPQFLLPRAQLQFYFDGPWADTHDMNNIRVTSRNLFLIDDPDAVESKPLSLSFAAFPEPLPGVLVAAKPAWAGHHLDQYEQQRISQGSLIAWQLDDDEASRLTTPLMNAWHVWGNF